MLPRSHESPLRLALHAMATRFELVLHGDDPVRLRGAGEEALEEIARAERRLSAYSPASEVSAINARAARCPVKVEPRLFRLLAACLSCSRATGGAFDPTVGPLVRAWRSAGPADRLPTKDERAAGLTACGARHVLLDEAGFTVGFAREGVTLDLGAAGKGYAIDLAIEALREHGVTSALLHGGTSSVHAIGAPPGDTGWKVAWEPPPGSPAAPRVLTLRDQAASISGIHGRTFTEGARRHGHVLDPRTGEPVDHTLAAGVTGPRSFECDMLSTALLVQGEAWLPEMRMAFPGYDGWVVTAESRPRPTPVRVQPPQT